MNNLILEISATPQCLECLSCLGIWSQTKSLKLPTIPTPFHHRSEIFIGSHSHINCLIIDRANFPILNPAVRILIHQSPLF